MKKLDTTGVLMTEIVLPSHTNALGTIFGGVVMSWIDIAGAIAATRHARSPVVTVSIDSLHFIVPIKIGYIVMIRAAVTFVGKTSMEVEVVVDAENSITGDTRKTTHAFLTYVAVDEFGRPKRVPPLPVPSTSAEKKHFEAASKRHQLRLSKKSH